jgi:hypothetical protein
MGTIQGVRSPDYACIARLQMLFEEFEMTPTKKIKRRPYSSLD